VVVFFFIGNYPGKLSNHIKLLFDCPGGYAFSVIFRRNGIDSVNPIPPINENKRTVGQRYLFRLLALLYNCHSNRDTVKQ
jgi:hypothetical protein